MDPQYRIAEIPLKRGQRSRILLQYRDRWYGILWLSIGNDGSLYFGERYENVGIPSLAFKRGVGKSISIYPEELDTLDEGMNITDNHVSLHPSGSVHVSGQRYFRQPLEVFDKQEHCASILFEHPKQYKPVKRKKSRTLDVHLFYPIEDEKPIIGELYLSPVDKERIVINPNATYQVNLIFKNHDLDRNLDVSCQLILWHGKKSQWPDATYTIIPAGKRISS